MDEAAAVLATLARIDALEQEGAPPHTLLAEVRTLLAEAETWIAAEPGGTERAAEALDSCRHAFERRQVVAMT
jgi:hypothetical protein